MISTNKNLTVVEDSHVRRLSNKSSLTQFNSQFRQVQITTKSSQLHENQKLSKTYWRTNFMLTCLPLIAWGIPSHLIFRKKSIQSTKEWLSVLCHCSCSSLLAIVLVILTLCYSFLLIYTIGQFFYVLLFTAEFDELFVQSCIEIVRNLPIVIPLNLFWIKGYHVRNCVASFDQFTLSFSKIDSHGAKITVPPGCRVKLFLVYSALILIHLIHFLIQYYDTDNVETLSSKSSAAVVWSVVFEYSTAISLSLIIPIYCTFCWAVDYQLKLFFEYVNVLICTGVVPTYEHFDEFKRCYRKIADDIMFINELFAIYLSVVIVIIGQLVYGEAQTLFLRLLKIIIDTFTNDDQAIEAAVKTLTLSEIRIMVGAFVIILSYLALFGFTYWQAVVVNDSVRYVHVWINDFVSEPVARLPTELFEGFTLLKWYIHSTLEQERPPLLNIMVVNLMPFLATRLRQYRVRH